MDEALRPPEPDPFSQIGGSIGISTGPRMHTGGLGSGGADADSASKGLGRGRHSGSGGLGLTDEQFREAIEKPLIADGQVLMGIDEKGNVGRVEFVDSDSNRSKIRLGKVDSSEASCTANVTTVSRRMQAQVRYCHDRRLRDDPDLSGNVVVSMGITGSGLPVDISVGGTTGDEVLEDCVKRKAARWKFAGCVTEVEIPFVLSLSTD